MFDCLKILKNCLCDCFTKVTVFHLILSHFVLQIPSLSPFFLFLSWNMSVLHQSLLIDTWISHFGEHTWFYPLWNIFCLKITWNCMYSTYFYCEITTSENTVWSSLFSFPLLVLTSKNTFYEKNGKQNCRNGTNNSCLIFLILLCTTFSSTFPVSCWKTWPHNSWNRYFRVPLNSVSNVIVVNYGVPDVIWDNGSSCWCYWRKEVWGKSFWISFFVFFHDYLYA